MTSALDIELIGVPDRCCDEHVALGVLVGLGFEGEELHKALVPALAPAPRGPDPRFPSLHLILDMALDIWRAGHEEIEAAIKRFALGGDLFPFTPTRERSWRIALQDIRRGWLLKLAGFDPAPGSDPVEPVTPSTVALAWRAGRTRDPWNPTGRSPERELAEARAYKPTKTDLAALDYVQRRAGSYLTVPTNTVIEMATRPILLEHHQRFQEAVRGGLDPKQTHARMGQAVAEALQGSALNNEVERVVRTEQAFAQGDGAKVALREAATRAGMADPWVWKAVRKNACVHCRRIWGRPGNARRYRLSEIEARDAAGGNVGLPAAEWGPVSGPVHPNCTEGPLQLHDDKVLAAVNAAMARWHHDSNQPTSS